MPSIDPESARAAVRAVYGQIATTKSEAGAPATRTGCCAPGCGCGPDTALKLGYSAEEIAATPDGADMALGCGNPQAIASLKPGETVLDLGAGGGFDALLAARQVGAKGHVIGVDMTPEMVQRARENAWKANVSNVEFRLGEIENLPVADASIDVIMSNCVINLSPDKQRVFDEAFRVLKPGGRLAISDVVALKDLPADIAGSIAALTGCIAGAAPIEDLKWMIAASGFADIRVTFNEASRAFVRDWLPGSGTEDHVAAALIQASKDG